MEMADVKVGFSILLNCFILQNSSPQKQHSFLFNGEKHQRTDIMYADLEKSLNCAIHIIRLIRHIRRPPSIDIDVSDQLLADRSPAIGVPQGLS